MGVEYMVTAVNQITKVRETVYLGEGRNDALNAYFNTKDDPEFDGVMFHSRQVSEWLERKPLSR